MLLNCVISTQAHDKVPGELLPPDSPSELEESTECDAPCESEGKDPADPSVSPKKALESAE